MSAGMPAPGDAILVVDPLPVPAAAAADALVRAGFAARCVAEDAPELAAAPAVLINARGDGASAAALVGALVRSPDRPLVIVSVAGQRHPAMVAVQAAGPDALILRPVQGALVARVVGRRLPAPAPAPGRPIDLAVDPGPALVLDTLRMVEQAQPGSAESMLRAFLADLDQAEADLAAAVADGDRPLVAALAHRLRGGGASLGALPLAAAAARLESDATGDAVPALRDVARCAASFRAAAAALRPGAARSG
jgi:HPt (histidine-containing phosphotransfer) domain-containing protein